MTTNRYASAADAHEAICAAVTIPPGDDRRPHLLWALRGALAQVAFRHGSLLGMVTSSERLTPRTRSEMLAHVERILASELRSIGRHEFTRELLVPARKARRRAGTCAARVARLHAHGRAVPERIARDFGAAFTAYRREQRYARCHADLLAWTTTTCADASRAARDTQP